MIHRFAATVTAAMIVLHALFGCCVHHSHSCAKHVAAGSAAVAKSHKAVKHCCSRDHSHDGKSRSEDHQEEQPCDEPNCNVVSDQRQTEVPSPGTPFGVSIAIADSTAAGLLNAPFLQGSTFREDANADSTLPMRAQFQIWRI